ncbi:hypothetical protein PHLH6_20480 [Pseudomonas sp. Seg1]|nr:hypothetical protein PHLH6_20480 [Pseudomonas sp. Seg1]
MPKAVASILMTPSWPATSSRFWLYWTVTPSGSKAAVKPTSWSPESAKLKLHLLRRSIRVPVTGTCGCLSSTCPGVSPDTSRALAKIQPPWLTSRWYRDKEAQNKALREGKSKQEWPHSKHNTLHIAPHPLDWSDSLAFARLAGYVQAVANAKGIPLRWDGDWDAKSKDERFLDLVHLELC